MRRDDERDGIGGAGPRRDVNEDEDGSSRCRSSVVVVVEGEGWVMAGNVEPETVTILVSAGVFVESRRCDSG